MRKFVVSLVTIAAIVACKVRNDSSSEVKAVKSFQHTTLTPGTDNNSDLGTITCAPGYRDRNFRTSEFTVAYSQVKNLTMEQLDQLYCTEWIADGGSNPGNGGGTTSGSSIVRSGNYDQNGTKIPNCSSLAVSPFVAQGQLLSVELKCAESSDAAVSITCQSNKCTGSGYELIPGDNNVIAVTFNNMRAQFTLDSTVCNKGIAIASACWFLTAANQSCSSRCTDEGMTYDERTRTVVGSSGSNDMYGKVLRRLDSRATGFVSEMQNCGGFSRDHRT